MLYQLNEMNKVEESLWLQMTDSEAAVKSFNAMLRQSSFWDGFMAMVQHSWMPPQAP